MIRLRIREDNLVRASIDVTNVGRQISFNDISNKEKVNYCLWTKNKTFWRVEFRGGRGYGALVSTVGCPVAATTTVQNVNHLFILTIIVFLRDFSLFLSFSKFFISIVFI